jgi:cell division protein FtsL
MNVAIRTLTESNVSMRAFGNLWTVLQMHVAVLLLSATVLLSSFGLVYVKDINRCLMADLQDRYVQYKQLRAEASQLLLEKSAWTAAAHVHQVATSKLGMVMPKAKSIILVQGV